MSKSQNVTVEELQPGVTLYRPERNEKVLAALAGFNKARHNGLRCKKRYHGTNRKKKGRCFKVENQIKFF